MWTLGSPASLESPSLLPGPKRGAISAVSSSPDGSLLAVLRDSGELQVWSGGPHFLLLGATKTFRALAIELHDGNIVPPVRINSSSASQHGIESNVNPSGAGTARAPSGGLVSKPAPGLSPVLVWRSDSASIAVLEPPNHGNWHASDGNNDDGKGGYNSPNSSHAIGLLGVYSVVVQLDQPVLELPLPGWVEQAGDWRGAAPGHGHSTGSSGGGSGANGTGGRARQTTAPPAVNLTPKVVMVASTAASMAESLAYRDAASHSSVGGTRAKAAAGAARGRWRSCLPGEPTAMCALPLSEAEKKTSKGRGRPHDESSLGKASSNMAEGGPKDVGSSGTKSLGVQLRVLVGTSCGLLCLIDCGPSFGGMPGGTFAVLRVFGTFGQLAAPPPSTYEQLPPLPLAKEANAPGLVASPSKRRLKDYIAERGSGVVKSPGRARSRSNSTGSLSNSTSGTTRVSCSNNINKTSTSTSTSTGSSSKPSTCSPASTTRPSSSTSDKLGIRALAAVPSSPLAHGNGGTQELLCFAAAVLEDGRCVAAALPLLSSGSESDSSGSFDGGSASALTLMIVQPPSRPAVSASSCSSSSTINLAWATSVAISPATAAGPVDAGCLLAVGWWAVSNYKITSNSGEIEASTSSRDMSPSAFAGGHGMVTLHRLTASTSSTSTIPVTSTTSTTQSTPEPQASASFQSTSTWTLTAPLCAPPLCLSALGWGGPVLPPAGVTTTSSLNAAAAAAAGAADIDGQSLNSLDAKQQHNLSDSSEKSTVKSSTSPSSVVPDERDSAWADVVAVNPGPPRALAFSPSSSSSSKSGSGSNDGGRRACTLAVAYAHRGFAVWEGNISAAPLLSSLPEVPPQFLSPSAGAWTEMLSDCSCSGKISSSIGSSDGRSSGGDDENSGDSPSHAWCSQATALLTIARPAPQQVSSTGGATAALSYGGVACLAWAGPGGSHLVAVPASSSAKDKPSPHLYNNSNASLVVHDVWHSARGPTGSCETPLLVSVDAIAVLDCLPWPSSSPSTYHNSSTSGDLRPHDATMSSKVVTVPPISSESAAAYRWRLVPLPPQYGAAYSPIQCHAVSNSGAHVAVAGLRGLALLNHPTHTKAGLSSSASSSNFDSNGNTTGRHGSLSKGGGGWSGLSGGTGAATGNSKSPHKWRLFGTEQQERVLRVINLTWWGDDYLVLVVDRSSGQANDDEMPLNHQSSSSTPPSISTRNAAYSGGATNSFSAFRRNCLAIEVYSRGQMGASSLVVTCPLPRGLQPSFLHIISAEPQNNDSSNRDDIGPCKKAILFVSNGFQFALFRLESSQKAAAGIPHQKPFAPGPWGTSAPSNGKLSCARVILSAEGQLPSVQNMVTTRSSWEEQGNQNHSFSSIPSDTSRGTNIDRNASGDAPCTAPVKEMRLIWVHNTTTKTPPRSSAGSLRSPLPRHSTEELQARRASELRILVLDADGALSTSEATALGRYGRRRVVATGVVNIWALELDHLLNLPLSNGTNQTCLNDDSSYTESNSAGGGTGPRTGGGATHGLFGAFLYLQRKSTKCSGSGSGEHSSTASGSCAAPLTLRCWFPNLSASLPAENPTLLAPSEGQRFRTPGSTTLGGNLRSDAPLSKVAPPRTPQHSPPSSDSWASEVFDKSSPTATKAPFASPPVSPSPSLLSPPPPLLHIDSKSSLNQSSCYQRVEATVEAIVADLLKAATPLVGPSTTLLSPVPTSGCLVALQQSATRASFPISPGNSSNENTSSKANPHGTAAIPSISAPPGYEPTSELISFLDVVVMELLALAVAEAEVDWNDRHNLNVSSTRNADEKYASGESSESNINLPTRKQRSASNGSRGGQSNKFDDEDTDGSYEKSEDETDDAEEGEGFNDTSAFDEDEVEAGAEWADIEIRAQQRYSLPEAALSPRASSAFNLAALVVQQTAQNASTQAALHQSLEKLLVAAAGATATMAARAAKHSSMASAAPGIASLSPDVNKKCLEPSTSAQIDTAAAMQRLKSVIGAGLGLTWKHAPGCYHEVVARAARQLEPNAATYLFQDFRQATSGDHNNTAGDCDIRGRDEASPLGGGSHSPLLPDPRPKGNDARSPVALVRACTQAGRLRVAAQLLPLAFPEHDGIEMMTVGAFIDDKADLGESASSSQLATALMSAHTAGLELLDACLNADCSVLPTNECNETTADGNFAEQIASPAGFICAGKWDPELTAEVWAFLNRMQVDKSQGCESHYIDSNTEHIDIGDHGCSKDGTLPPSGAATFGRSFVDNGDGALVLSHAPITDNEEESAGSNISTTSARVRVETSAQVLTLFVLRQLSAGHVAAVLRPFSDVPGSPHGALSFNLCSSLIPCGWAIAWRAPVRQRLVFAFTCLEDTFNLTRIATAGTGTTIAPTTAANTAASGGKDCEDSKAYLKLPLGTARELVKLLEVTSACRLDAWSVAAATLLRDRSAVQRALSSPWSHFVGSYSTGTDLGGLALASVHGVTAADYEAVVEVLTAELTGNLWGDTLRWAADTARDMWEDD